MAYYRLIGDVPPKRHTQHRRPDGGLYYEELMGEEGFSSDSSLLYHRHLPSAIVDATPWDLISAYPSASRPWSKGGCRRAGSGHGGIFQFHDKFAPIAVKFLAR